MIKTRTGDLSGTSGSSVNTIYGGITGEMFSNGKCNIYFDGVYTKVDNTKMWNFISKDDIKSLLDLNSITIPDGFAKVIA